MTGRPTTPSRIRQNLAMCVHDGRIPGINVLIAALVSCYLGLVGSATRASADDKPTDDLSRKLFKQYCQTCHSGAKPKGDFRVDALSQVFADKVDCEKWLKVLEQLKMGTMPPKGKPRPAVQETKALIDWIDSRVAAADVVRTSSQGLAVMRRLNQVEYENTVRDLLQVDVELKDLLPVDSVAGGFDTSAEALHFSSYQLANYVEAADRVLDAAVAAKSSRSNRWPMPRRSSASSRGGPSGRR